MIHWYLLPGAGVTYDDDALAVPTGIVPEFDPILWWRLRERRTELESYWLTWGVNLTTQERVKVGFDASEILLPIEKRIQSVLYRPFNRFIRGANPRVDPTGLKVQLECSEGRRRKASGFYLDLNLGGELLAIECPLFVSE